MNGVRSWSLLVLTMLVVAGGRSWSPPANAAEAPTAEQLEFFEAKIRPILVTHCYECHSSMSSPAKGGLRLDDRQALLGGGDSGPAVSPGQPDDSLLLEALRYESLEMPPKGKLPAAVIADFERWIALGAPDPRTGAAAPKSTGIDYEKAAEFWAFRRPVRPTPPDVGGPTVHNDIDRFVLSQLQQRGLKPAAPADRRVLIRRAYFDLIGLPPDPEAVERFVHDPLEGAFDRVIDELLASPHYGERWGRYWLDLARFAEDQAHTFKARMYPQGYLYRDWVVQAFNDDLPYDQFLRLQIAGDQLDVPEAHQHRAALGLFALGPVYYQDNGEQDKAQADEWDDRIDVLMRGTQALTVACARCHDHKYDPISMSDYYGLAGIFASSDYRELPAVPDEIVERRRQADQVVKDQQAQIDSFLVTQAPAARWKMTTSIPKYLEASWKLLATESAADNDKQKAKRIEQAAKEQELNPELLKRWIAWLKEEPGSGAVDIPRPYLEAWRELRDAERSGEAAAAQRQAKLRTIGEQWQARAEEWLVQRTELLGRFGADFAFVSPEERAKAEQQATPIGYFFDDPEWAAQRVAATFLSELFDERGVLALPAPQVGPLLEGQPAATLAELKRELESLQKKSAAIQITLAHTLVDAKSRDLKIYLAGDPKKLGEPAPRGFPAILTAGQRQPFTTEGSGRRELADAIASADNPLTARVMANRVWAGHFGFGLVRTLTNFGELGERPSHPELLDWLAVELMESGWSLKHLHRQIMRSATYQQSSVGDPTNQEVDADNRLLWRMNRRRLEVEPWRDAVLSVSGQLNPAVGGPSAELNPEHRRRTLYGFVSRHRLNDLLRLFDFPDPNITAGERAVTTVPLQQLFVLNSDFMVSQAKALAARVQQEQTGDQQRVERVFALLFGRPPSEHELRTAVEFLAGAPAESGDALSPWEQFCLAMLGTNEFAYVD